ncbi:MAG: VWA domain-containing protein [Acidobacteriota bacterium]
MRFPNWFQAALASLPFIALCLTPAEAQESETAFAETVSVNVVNIDVRVTDRDGNPVPGLTVDAFSLREDGDNVEITNFSEVPPRPKDPAATVGEDNVDVPSALLVFLVDDTVAEAKDRKRALGEIRSAIDGGFDANTAATVAVINEGLRILVQPTGDVNQLKAAVDLLGEAPAQGLIRQRERDADLREVLREVGETLSEFRSQAIEPDEALAGVDNRLATGHASQGFDQAALDVIQEALAEITSVGGGEGSSASIDSRSAALEALSDQVRAQKRRPNRKSAPPQDLIAVSALAAKAGVSFYAWKAHGNIGVAAAELGGEAALGATASVRAARENSLTETLNILADETGGRMALGGGFAGLVESAVEDFGGYYSLGFSPEHGGDNQLHKLKVKVRGRGLDVWHPKSYIALPPAAGPGGGS